MAPRDGDRATFRQDLVRLREVTRVSQRALGRLLAEHGGDDISGSAVGEWERGQSAPSRRNALALDRYARSVGYDAAFAVTLGFHPDADDGVSARVAALEAELALLRAALPSPKDRTPDARRARGGTP